MKLLLKYFNAVLEQPLGNVYATSEKDLVSNLGYIITSNALYAKEDIEQFWNETRLDGKGLNKTFYNSYKEVLEQSDLSLFLNQQLHYESTYGTNFKGDAYIPRNEDIQNIPEFNIESGHVVFEALSKEVLIEKAMEMLISGVALDIDTIEDLIIILSDTLGYVFKQSDLNNIKNREALVIITDKFNIYPSNVIDFFRLIVYKTTGESTLIKNKSLINKIKDSGYNPAIEFTNYGLIELSTIFNRFKPLFLAYKNKAPRTINKISKLSKTYHRPMVQNPLNEITQRKILDTELHWFENATTFALLRALQSAELKSVTEDETSTNKRYYTIRNGKVWIDLEENNNKVDVSKFINSNIIKIYNELHRRIDFKDLKFYIPDNIQYGIPTSEKQMLGNIPKNTIIYGDGLSVGVYWKNEWGARDLDLFALDDDTKVGWNGLHKSKDILFSGDITNAPNGAVEYMQQIGEGVKTPTLLTLNIYSSEPESSYKIIVGEGNEVSYNYMMNPNNLLLEADVKRTKDRQTVLGLLLPKNKNENSKFYNKQGYLILNSGMGENQITHINDITKSLSDILYHERKHLKTLGDFIVSMGGEIVDDISEADVDLSINNLKKDTILNLLNGVVEVKTDAENMVKITSV